jgi:hypothetical protein
MIVGPPKRRTVYQVLFVVGAIALPLLLYIAGYVVAELIPLRNAQ